MSPTRLIVATVILAALGGAIYWSNQNEAAKESQRDPDAPPILLELPEIDMDRVEITRAGEAPTVVQRDENRSWSIIEPQPLPADLGVLATLTSVVSNLESLRVVDEAPSDLSAYGLDPAEVTLTFTMNDGAEHTLQLGADTPDGNGTFATVSGDPTLYTIEAFQKAKFDKTTLELREPHLLQFDTNQLTQLTYARPGQATIVLARDDDRWSITRPRALRADNLAIQSFLASLADLKLDPQIERRFSDSGFASGERWAIITLRTPDGDIELELRESLGQYIARSSQVEGVYQVSAEAGTDFNKTLDDFQNAKLFDFGFDTPTRIEYTSEDAGNRIIEKVNGDDGDEWVERGSVMDSVGVQTLLSRLRELEGSPFDDGTFRDPEIEIDITSAEDGQQVVEQLELAPGGSGYLARRSDSPVVYLVEEAAVSRLRQALASVREAPEVQE